MSDRDDLPRKGIPFFAVVDGTGASTDGTSATISTIRNRGMEPICEVDATGVAASGATLNILRNRGIQFYCPITEAGVTSGAVTMTTLRNRGIPFYCPVGVDGIATGGTLTIAQLAARGIPYICLLDSLGGAGSPPIIPGVLSAGAGSYVWSGDTMTPLVDHLLPATGGSYTFTGQDVTLTASGGGSGTPPAFDADVFVAENTTISTLPLETAGGSGVIVVGIVVSGTSTTVSSVTATGLTFTANSVSPFTGGACLHYIYTAPYSSNFNGNVVVTTSAGVYRGIAVVAFSGAAAAPSEDSGGPATNGAGAPSMTTTFAGDAVFSVMLTDGTSATAGAGWTTVTGSNGTSFVLAMYRIEAATGTFTASATAGSITAGIITGIKGI